MPFSFGIIGGGYVGSATALLQSSQIPCFIYDLDPNKCSPSGTTLNDILNTDLIFICVPTPSNEDGSCNISIVNSVAQQLAGKDVVIRSTVPPGTSSTLGISFMPEFLTEQNWANDIRKRNQWIIGVPQTEMGDRIYTKVKKILIGACQDEKISGHDMMKVTPDEAELAKYVRNCFLATKVAYFNEIHEYCQKKGIDYQKVSSLSSLDPRIGASHMQVPGPDGKYGFGGTCFPKDISALISIFRDGNVDSPILNAAKSRNLIDRNK